MHFSLLLLFGVSLRRGKINLFHFWPFFKPPSLEFESSKKGWEPNGSLSASKVWRTRSHILNWLFKMCVLMQNLGRFCLYGGNHIMWCSDDYVSWFLSVQSKFLPKNILNSYCLQDHVVHVWWLFLLKLHKCLKDQKFHLKFASGFALCVVDLMKIKHPSSNYQWIALHLH